MGFSFLHLLHQVEVISGSFAAPLPFILAAIECFENAGAIVVPRTRFAPVKTCSDLFVLRSDVYTITPEATVKAVVETVSRV